jgi:hypothetical protein
METNAFNELSPITPPENFKVCLDCGQQFEVPSFKIAAKFITTCPQCSEKLIEADRVRMVADAGKNFGNRTDRWVKICPPLYAQTEVHKLPHPSKLDRVLQWRFGSRGMIFIGDSGSGKSRCAWMLLKREFLSGKSISVINAGSGYDFAKTYAEGTDAASRWIKRHCDSDILLLDDAVKVKLTESYEGALFMIINHRIEHCLPIICTLNDTGETLGERLSLDRGPALIRRLREFCDTISF